MTASTSRRHLNHHDAEGTCETVNEDDEFSITAAERIHLPTPGTAVMATAMMGCHRPNEYGNCASCAHPSRWWRWHATPQRSPHTMVTVHDVARDRPQAILTGRLGVLIPDRYSTDR